MCLAPIIDAPASSIRASFIIAGALCRVRSNSRSLLASLRAIPDATEEDSEERSVTTPDSFTLTVIVTTRDSHINEHQPRFRGRDHLLFASFGAGNVFTFDLLRREITASISEGLARNSSFWQSTLLPIAIGVLGPSLGIAPLHCACLTAGNSGLLLAGVSGAGKSTLAAAMGQSGFDLLSDDWTYISARPESDDLHAHGLTVPVKLLPDAVNHFPELRGQTLGLAMNGEMSFEVDPAVLNIRSAESCVPSRLIFVRRISPPELRLTPVEPNLACEFFLRSAERLPPELTGAAHRRSSIIDRIASLECWLFSYGGPPHPAARFLHTWHMERVHA
ncbi:MAG: hypothetical protein AB7O65_05640 [Candidatus Korobacteraceae bacterium]